LTFGSANSFLGEPFYGCLLVECFNSGDAAAEKGEERRAKSGERDNETQDN